MEKLALDTSVCIELIKENPAVKSFLNAFHARKVYVSTITCFELLLRKHNLDPVESFLNATGIIRFDEPAARKAAEIAKNLSRTGSTVQSHDIFIAATAIVNGCALATLNFKDFSKIKELKLLQVS